jgi:hypothetical protein
MHRIYRQPRRVVVWLGLEHAWDFAPSFTALPQVMPCATLLDFVPFLQKIVGRHLYQLSTDPLELWGGAPDVKMEWGK